MSKPANWITVQTGDPYDPGDKSEYEYGWGSIILFGVVVGILVFGAWRSKKRGEW